MRSFWGLCGGGGFEGWGHPLRCHIGEMSTEFSRLYGLGQWEDEAGEAGVWPWGSQLFDEAVMSFDAGLLAQMRTELLRREACLEVVHIFDPYE